MELFQIQYSKKKYFVLYYKSILNQTKSKYIIEMTEIKFDRL